MIIVPKRAIKLTKWIGPTNMFKNELIQKQSIEKMKITVCRNQGALVFSVLSTSFDIVFSSDSVVALTKSCK